jgi:hypothetical protein
MRWDEEQDIALPVVAMRPVVMDAIIVIGKRFRHPAVHAEVTRRVGVYARQVERQGYITWLPRRGSGN